MMSMTIISAKCPKDMIEFPTFCIDKYEAPNQEGVIPFAFQIASDGETWCKTKGKRLCHEKEWEFSCSSKFNFLYPYGNQHRKSHCNDDKIWKNANWNLLAKYPKSEAMKEAKRLYQGDKSGFRKECKSNDGVFDLTGNVGEWVRVDYHPKNYTHVIKGCYWSKCYKGVLPNCKFRNSAHSQNFRSYEFGFRCCKNIE